MFKREIKVNFKSFLIWTGILFAIFLVVFLIYPALIAGEQMDRMNELLSVFPEDILKAFNMDIASIDSAFGWMKTEGFVFVLLITAVYSSMLGWTIVLKEESDKTIEYLHSLPVTRRQIMLQKALAALMYIVLMILGLGIFNYVGLCGSDDFNSRQFLLLSLTPLFSSLVFFTLSLFLSTFARKTKKVLGISLGLVFLSYFLNMFAELSEKAGFLKYFSIFTLADVRNVLTKERLDPVLIVISFVLSALFLALSFVRYERKELV